MENAISNEITFSLNYEFSTFVLVLLGIMLGSLWQGDSDEQFMAVYVRH